MVDMSVVLNIARGYLNDDNATQFPDPVLIPKIQEAHRELQEELWVVGSPVVRAQTPALAVPNTVTELTSSSTPALPSDFLCPTSLFESAAAIGPYTPMTEAFYIPLGYTKVVTLNWWSWQQEKIVLGGALGTVYVIIQYRRQIPIPTLATSPIGMLFAESYLGARAAAIAAGTLGNDAVYAALTALSKENLAKVISANRGQQKPALKP